MERTEKIIAELVRVYETAVSTLRSDIAAFAADGTLPPPTRRENREWCYPELRVRYQGEETRPDLARAFGRLAHPGEFSTTITRPALFSPYLAEQLDLLQDDYRIEITVTRSAQEIPFPYVLDSGTGLGTIRPQDLARHFPATELAMIGDELADGVEVDGLDETIPLALFDALRTDFSLARLAHYTGTSVEHFQRFVLFTNYHRYVDEFVDWAGKQLGQNGYTLLSGAGGLLLDEPTENARERLSDTAWRRHQMPAYHLVAPGRDGISLSRPPAPMRMMSRRSIGSPAATRCSTQSKPLSLGERAQPGRPSTGTVPIRASSQFFDSRATPMRNPTMVARTMPRIDTSRVL